MIRRLGCSTSPHTSPARNPGRATVLMPELGRLLTDGGPTHAQALLERARTPARSMGQLARTLEDYFVNDGLAVRLDQVQRCAAERRRRRVAEIPEALRAQVVEFEAAMMAEGERARRAGTRPRADHTIEHHLATARDFARFLIEHRGKRGWALVDVGNIEAFVATRPATAKPWPTGLRRQMRTAKALRSS